MAHGHANRASVKNAMYDVITAHFNGEYDAATAVEEMVDLDGEDDGHVTLLDLAPGFQRRQDDSEPTRVRVRAVTDHQVNIVLEVIRGLKLLVDKSADGLAKTIAREVKDHMGDTPQFDDITILTVSRH